MKKQVTVLDVNVINARKNLVKIDLQGYTSPLFREPKLFLIDLKNSFIIDNSVETINHPDVLRALRNMIGCTVLVDIQHTKIGDTIEVTEHSRCLKDSTHPHYGKKIGDKYLAEKESIRPNGFCKFIIDKLEMLDAVAKAKINGTSSVSSMFGGSFGAETTSTETPTETPDIIKDEKEE